MTFTVTWSWRMTVSINTVETTTDTFRPFIASFLQMLSRMKAYRLSRPDVDSLVVFASPATMDLGQDEDSSITLRSRYLVVILV